MSREILVVTPENIEIEFELAGVGSRFMANFLDQLAQIAIFALLGIALLLIYMALGFLFMAGHQSGIWTAVVGFIGAEVLAISTIIGFIIVYGYFTYFEIRWNGQTVGKRALGLRVIREGGYPITAFSAFTRNLLRVIDGMPLMTVVILISATATKDPLLFAVGGGQILLTVCMLLFTSRYQRLGDIVAGTLVVKQRAPRVPTLEALAPPPRVLPERLAAWALADIGRHVDDMSIPEYRAVRYFTDRRWQLSPELQGEAAMKLAVPLMKRLELEAPAGSVSVNYVDLLEYLAVAFEQHRGVK